MNDIKELRVWFFAIAVYMVLSILMFSWIKVQMDYFEFTLMGIDRVKLFNRSHIENTQANGVYYPDGDVYCVWASENDPVKVSNTEAHERCHYLIDEGDKEHFCKE